MRNFFDQSKHPQTRQLTRQCRGRQRHMFGQVRPPTAVNIELTMLQGFEQRLLSRVEEVQAFDGLLRAHWHFGLTQSLQVALAFTGVIQTAKKRQVALVAAQQYLAQVDQAVDRLLEGSQLSRAVPLPVFHLAGGA